MSDGGRTPRAFKDWTLEPVNADKIHACSVTNDVLLRQWLQRQKGQIHGKLSAATGSLSIMKGSGPSITKPDCVSRASALASFACLLQSGPAR